MAAARACPTHQLIMAISVAGFLMLRAAPTSGGPSYLEPTPGADSVRLDLEGSVRGCRPMARRLMSDDVAVWREAQVRLAAAGPAALRVLETEKLARTSLGRMRVCEVLKLALLMTVTPSVLSRYPGLSACVADSIARGHRLVASLPRKSYLGSHEGPVELRYALGPDDTLQEEPTPQADVVTQLLALGGFAVPGLLQRLHSPLAIERAEACIVLNTLSAVPIVDSLVPLVDDAAVVDHWHGCYSTRTTVGKVAHDVIAGLQSVGSDRLRFERPIFILARTWWPFEDGTGLINGIRRTSRSLEAPNWNDWWDAAWPAWNDWWTLSGDRGWPADREEWLNALNEYEGFRLDRRSNTQPRTEVRIVGPHGTRCRVETDSTTVAEGAVPLVVVREQDSLSVKARMSREERGDYSGRLFTVFVSFPDGGTWNKTFFWYPSLLLTIETMPEPRPKPEHRR